MSFDDLTPVYVDRDGGIRCRSLRGDEIVVQLTGEETGGAYAFLEYYAAPGSPPQPAHVHDGHEEMWYVVDEPLMMMAGERVLEVAPGECVFVPRTVPHTFWNAGSRTCKFLSVFSPPGFEQIFVEWTRMLDAEGLRRLPAGGRGLPADYAALGERYGMRVTGERPPPEALR